MTDRQQGGEGSGIVDRLRQRKVVQWGVAYVAGAWGLLQGLAYVSATFDWPRHVQQLSTIALLVGLPFENRSAKPDDAFFVDGVHDDILTQLSKVSALRVISRTSVERFRKTELSTQQIAAQLGVKSILEGGVQRAGGRRATIPQGNRP